jgi:hypothetical protein
MRQLIDRAWVATATTGTGTITLGSAQSGYATFAEAGVVAGPIEYCIIDGSNFEIGTGTYASGGPTISRDTVHLSKISGTAGTSKINLSGSATVFATIRGATLELTAYGAREMQRMGAVTL